jgi:hypothetical protein
MNQGTPEPSENTPFTFISAAGTPVLITDEWVEECLTDMDLATVIDKVTSEKHKFVLVVSEDEGNPIMHWLRRVNKSCYIDTGLFAPMDYVPDDTDEFSEAYGETLDNAQMELVMAVGLFPRYDIQAEWMDESRQKYLNKLRFGADAADIETVEGVRASLLGISKLL